MVESICGVILFSSLFAYTKKSPFVSIFFAIALFFVHLFLLQLFAQGYYLLYFLSLTVLLIALYHKLQVLTQIKILWSVCSFLLSVLLYIWSDLWRFEFLVSLELYKPVYLHPFLLYSLSLLHFIVGIFLFLLVKKSL